MDRDDGALSAAAEQRRRREDRHETFIEILYAGVVLGALWGIADIITRLRLGFGAEKALTTFGWIVVLFVLSKRSSLRQRQWEREQADTGS